ncbi:MAG: TetR/AcrR family transcriptional regulator [Actinomycetia bacterium]|nr:TetR/AcrR family transcriptional regulator [Actinomycetes bacterium]
MSTPDRILDAALASFGSRGYGATSLDGLAAELGVTKQTILYHFSSKEGVLEAAIDRAAADLTEALQSTLAQARSGWDRVEAVVRTVFRLGLQRPELPGLIREVTRLGPPASTRLAEALEPLLAAARASLEREMEAGTIRTTDARLLLVSLYSTVIGAVTEVEVLRAVGVEPTVRTAVRRRRELLDFLHAALRAG